MRKFILILIALLLVFSCLPTGRVFADCSKTGTTVIFVNGIWSTQASAQADKNKLEFFYKNYGKITDINFYNGFNPSHVFRIEDIVTSVLQAYGVGGMDFDLTNILLQAHVDLKTQKILLVGHSQGTFYTNAAYDYLVKNGVDKNSIAVYNVATPADVVAGNGGYLNSSTDEIINKIVRDLASAGNAHKPLPANININIPQNTPNPENGHSFSNVYLGLAPDKIVGDMDSQLNGLTATGNKSECFAAPKTDIIYNIQAGGYYITDNIGKYSDAFATSPGPDQLASLANSIFQTVYNFGQTIVSSVAQAFGQNNSPAGLSPALTQNNPTPPPPNTNQNLLTDYTGTGGPEPSQDLLDDITEKNDLLHPKIPPPLPPIPPTQSTSTKDTNNNTKPNTGGGGGSPTISITTYTISNTTISPNGDGVNDTTSIDLAFSEEVKADVNIFNSSGVKVRDLYSSSSVKNPDPKIWDGKDNLGVVVPNGVYTISVVISDSAGNSITDTSKTITINNSVPGQSDATAPIITLIGNSELTIDAGYAYADAGATAVDDVDGDITAKIAVVNPVDVNVIGDYTITYNVSDAAGNHALEVTRLVHVIAAVPKILITEVQVAGQTANDEFVELYNPNIFDVDLSKFALKKKISIGTESNLVSSESFFGTIPANGYFLIIPQKNNGSEQYAGQVTPDMLRYSGTSYSITPNNTVLLYNNSGILLDKVGFGTASDFETAPAQEPSAGQSIQRIWDLNANKPQDTDDNSADFHIFDATTPKAASLQYCSFDNYNNFTFLTDTTLKKSCTYIFRGNEIVLHGVTLTIEPGVVIKFDSGASMSVSGTIKAIGTDAEKIIFTSFLDDQYGGDTNADGNSSTPAEGNWQGIYFAPESSGSQFEYSSFRYGGGSLSSIGAVIKADQSAISIKNSVFENNLNRGLYLINTSSTIDSDNFLGQQYADAWLPFEARAIDVFGGSDQITNCYFKNNNFGISISNWTDSGGNAVLAQTLVQNNNFEDNWLAIDENTFDHPTFSGNKASGTFYNAIRLSGTMEGDVELAPDIPYLIKEILTVPAGKTLTLDPGVIMAFQYNDSGMQVDGTLKAIGTPSSAIIFRHYFYDRSWTAPGKWMGLYFTASSSNSDLENTEFYLGGSFYNLDATTEYGAAIKVDQSSIMLKDSSVHDNKNSGVWLINSPATMIDTVQFLNHRTASDGRVAKAVYIQGGSPEIKNSHFQAQSYGIYKDSASTPNLHTADPDDPEKNTFMDTDVAGGDIYTEP
ncbi:MAG: DUF5011 domain-containing protein [Candidatus Staskawiczbacteria bacterium]|nr:DUF5011 domain-containing protein [Candidatus Staskawiczbacteria bacterium]